MNQKYWEEFYKENHHQKQSTFAEYCLPLFNGDVVDLGCGEGPDVAFFVKKMMTAIGIDPAFENELVLKKDVLTFMEENESPDNVYARFFWHAITREEQLKILAWTKDQIFIEARTTQDKDVEKIYANHERNYVDVLELTKDLSNAGFEIQEMTQGHGLSVFKGEDPHLVRVFAKKRT